MSHPNKSKVRNVSVPDVSEVVAKKTRKRSVKAEDKVPLPPPIEEVPPPSIPEESEVPVSEPLPVSDLSVDERFQSLFDLVQEELVKTRENKSRVVSPNVWRGILKDLKGLKQAVAKTSKKPKRKVVNGNSKSGLLKPVQISKEMADFAGWDPSESKSRVDVYKTICKYVKDNNLQNPSDRRQIVADSTLKKLLKYDEQTDSKPLTYCYLQTMMKPHFIKSA